MYKFISGLQSWLVKLHLEADPDLFAFFFIIDGILKLPCTPDIMNVSRKERLANVLIPLLYLTITIKAMKYHITS